MLVNNLTAKLSKLLFPIGVSFFRLKDTKDLQSALAKLDPALRKVPLAEI